MKSEQTITERIESISNKQESNIDLLKKLYKNDKDSDGYWGVEDIAKYIKKSISTVRRKIITDPRFPKPLSFGKNSSKRWLASEVKIALLSFRDDE